MSIEEQELIKQEAYAEALRYMNNAKETLQKASKEDNTYKDNKYVRTACGTAYNGILIALDAYLNLKGVPDPKHKSIDHYRKNIGKIDRKLLSDLNNTYQILHINGYYDGTTDARLVKLGFDEAYEIIERIKPNQSIAWSPAIKKPSAMRRLYSLLFL